jgi:hypothetical protein
LGLAGCRAEINTKYGKRRGQDRVSVNGTSVFSEMFVQEGHRVSTWTQLSPRLNRSQSIVWIPNSFELPTTDAIEFLEGWLSEDPGRTLIYVARDYDAAIGYYQQLAASSSGQDFINARGKLGRAQSDHALSRSYTGKEMKCDWFALESEQSFVRATPNGGTWQDRFDPSKTDIHVASRMRVNVPHTTLLDSDQSPLIVRITNDDWPGSQILLVVNGSMILNLPLVNHEHRKIAASLINACGSGRVTFLESGPGEIRVSDEDLRAYTGFEAFTVWPISSILMHLTIAGILYCVMVFPIFGKPRDVVEGTTSDFGKHIRAQGELLAQVNDRHEALRHIQQYRQLSEQKPNTDTPDDGNPFQNSTEATPA